jgi:transposase
MLDHSTRTAILRLHEQGHGSRKIATALGVSRGAVRAVIASRHATVPDIERASQLDACLAQISALSKACKGNLVRVYEELVEDGATFSYQALTHFCRRHGISRPAAKPSGAYTFEHGQEMQHDTSPHRASIAGKMHKVQTASLVLCHSRLMYAQCYPTFTRFDCKRFLAKAIAYVGGVCKVCMIDNTHVVVLSGTGRDMVPVPEMAAFAARYGFTFRAHAKGHANRSARVERPFHFIENNFFAGRSFDSWEHLNTELLAWCDRVNEAPNRHLGASRRQLFEEERVALVPLPLWVPDVYQLHHRVVDLQGYVQVSKTRYSAPYQQIGRRVEVRESDAWVDIYLGPRLVARHARYGGTGSARVTDPTHRPPRGQGPRAKCAGDFDERALLQRAPQLAPYVTASKGRAGTGPRFFRALLRLATDYPIEAMLPAVETAMRFGLYDVSRLERMVLRNIAHDYFIISTPPQEDEDS